jgi:ABC-type nitrate/sulfonate/bicarbonate transport system permease component
MAIAKPSRSAPAAWRRPNVLRLSSLALTLGVWEWYGRQVDPIFFSYPTAIAAAIPELIKRGELQKDLLVSLTELSCGLAIAIAIGTVVGLLMGRYRILDNLIEWQISALYSMPNVALVPLLILWFGLGFESKVVLIFLAGCFPVIVNTYGGVRNISSSLIDIARAEGANELQILRKIIMPASVPFIMTGIRLAIGRAVVGMVVAEMFMATGGLGGALIAYGNAFATDKMLLVIIILSLIGVILTEIVRLTETRMAAWKLTDRAQ